MAIPGCPKCGMTRGITMDNKFIYCLDHVTCGFTEYYEEPEEEDDEEEDEDDAFHCPHCGKEIDEDLLPKE